MLYANVAYMFIENSTSRYPILFNILLLYYIILSLCSIHHFFVIVFTY